MLENPFKIDRKIILASGSPRRQSLLKSLGIPFIIKVKDIEEDYPPDIGINNVAPFLAEKKAKAYDKEVNDGYLVITADTVVRFNETIINKPIDHKDGFRILKKLSGNMHTVTTGVCIRFDNDIHVFSVDTDVHFKELQDSEIEYYLNNYKPYDKAGAYGVQEWIGLMAIYKMVGSYHNVMGLPTSELYSYLKKFEV